MTYFLARANQAEEAIERVRELHVPKEYENTCKTCDKTDTGMGLLHPCLSCHMSYKYSHTL